MAHGDLNVLSACLAVAEERSFTKAAVRGLEEAIGVRLLARTTRSVAPTGAGEELLRSLRPALTDIRAALGRVSGRRDRPAGRVRLVVSPLAAESVLGPKLGAFARTYPEVVLDITTDESRVDLVAGGYDAGITTGVHRHGRGPRLAGSPAGDRRFGEVLRVASAFPGFFLYYPSRRQQPAALSALIATLRLENPRQ